MKKAIISYLEHVQVKRTEVGERYGDDYRNKRCAKELEEFINFISSLDEDDQRFKKIKEYHTWGTDVYMPSETVSRTIFRLGFSKSLDGKYDDFFTRMIENDEEEAKNNTYHIIYQIKSRSPASLSTGGLLQIYRKQMENTQ